MAQRLWAEQRTRPLDEITPYGAILLSYRFFFNREPRRPPPRRASALERIVRERPECQLAWVQLARLNSANYAFEIAELDTSIDQAISFAQQGVQLDPSSQRARAVLAGAFLIKGELGAGRAEAEKAYDLNPDSLHLSRVDRLADHAARRLGARPGDHPARDGAQPPSHSSALHALWVDHVRRGRDRRGLPGWPLRYPDATFFWRSLMRACCLGHLGRRAEAKPELAELLQKKPDFARRGRTLIGRYIKFPDLLEQIVDGLRKAGLKLE